MHITNKDGKEIHEGVLHLKHDVGNHLNKALAALEEANPDKLSGVLTNVNFLRKIGKNKNALSDQKLVEFIQHFNEVEFIDENFEFPDLLGAAYEYLIKYFADSAGKKAGEFYTPNEVVKLLVRILDPEKGKAIYDPTCGSGGMLIEAKNYIDGKYQGYLREWKVFDYEEIKSAPGWGVLIEKTRIVICYRNEVLGIALCYNTGNFIEQDTLSAIKSMYSSRR